MALFGAAYSSASKYLKTHINTVIKDTKSGIKNIEKNNPIHKAIEEIGKLHYIANAMIDHIDTLILFADVAGESSHLTEPARKKFKEFFELNAEEFDEFMEVVHTLSVKIVWFLKKFKTDDTAPKDFRESVNKSLKLGKTVSKDYAENCDTFSKGLHQLIRALDVIGKILRINVVKNAIGLVVTTSRVNNIYDLLMTAERSAKKTLEINEKACRIVKQMIAGKKLEDLVPAHELPHSNVDKDKIKKLESLNMTDGLKTIELQAQEITKHDTSTENFVPHPQENSSVVPIQAPIQAPIQTPVQPPVQVPTENSNAKSQHDILDEIEDLQVILGKLLD